MPGQTVTCLDLGLGLNPGCDALKKVGGIEPGVYVGQLSELDSYTINSTTLDIESLTLITSPAGSLRWFKGKKFKNFATQEVTVGENIRTFNQGFNLVLYHFSSVEKKAIEDLVGADDIFVMAPTNAGQIEVYGIDTLGVSTNDPIGGLNCSAGSGGSGTLLNDPNSFLVTLTGEHRIISRIFNISAAATIAQNRAYLDLITT